MMLLVDKRLEREYRLPKPASAYSGGVVGSLTGPFKETRERRVEIRSRS